jgi:RimJ/RimL family protein N-acetyltransferase
MNNIKHKPIYNQDGIETAGLFYYIKDKEEVGQLEYRYFPSFDGYMLSDFKVEEKFRGRGYGTLLMTVAILHLRKDNSEIEIIANVNAESEAAVKIFKKNNFINDKEYVNGNNVHVILYKSKE